MFGHILTEERLKRKPVILLGKRGEREGANEICARQLGWQMHATKYHQQPFVSREINCEIHVFPHQNTLQHSCFPVSSVKHDQKGILYIWLKMHHLYIVKTYYKKV